MKEEAVLRDTNVKKCLCNVQSDIMFNYRLKEKSLVMGRNFMLLKLKVFVSKIYSIADYFIEGNPHYLNSKTSSNQSITIQI